MLHSLPSVFTALVTNETEPIAATIANAAAAVATRLPVPLPATIGVNASRCTPQTIPKEMPCKATPMSEPRSRFWSGGLEGFLRKRKTPANANQHNITMTNVRVGRNSKVILIMHYRSTSRWPVRIQPKANARLKYPGRLASRSYEPVSPVYEAVVGILASCS